MSVQRSDAEGGQLWTKPGTPSVEGYDFKLGTWGGLELHRLDGPAILAPNGTKYWYRTGRVHREDGPAILTAYGPKYWYRDGRLHREDGPAILTEAGTKYWYRFGKVHRDDGPAIISSDGSQGWYFDNRAMTEIEFNQHPVVRELARKRNFLALAAGQNRGGPRLPTELVEQIALDVGLSIGSTA